mgnify:FL=1
MDYNKIQQRLSFTIPIRLYQDKQYCNIRRAIIILIADILQKNKKWNLKT